MVSPVSGSHSSRKSRWFTLPPQQPWTHASGASGPVAALSDACSGVAAPGGGDGCCWANAFAASSAASAAATRNGWRNVGIIVPLFLLLPSQWEVQQQVLRLQSQSMVAIHRHRQV